MLVESVWNVTIYLNNSTEHHNLHGDQCQYRIYLYINQCYTTVRRLYFNHSSASPSLLNLDPNKIINTLLHLPP